MRTAAIALILTTGALADESKKKQTKWEHTCTVVQSAQNGVNNNDFTIPAFGDGGWELAAMSYLGGGSPGSRNQLFVCFKRPKE
jgi:hypothetical protein